MIEFFGGQSGKRNAKNARRAPTGPEKPENTAPADKCLAAVPTRLWRFSEPP